MARELPSTFLWGQTRFTLRRAGLIILTGTQTYLYLKCDSLFLSREDSMFNYYLPCHSEYVSKLHENSDTVNFLSILDSFLS